MGDGVQLGSAYGVVDIDVSGVRQGVQSAEQSLTGLSRQFAAIGTTLSLGVTLPLVAVGKQAVGTAMDFQSSLNMFDAVADATDAQMEQVRQTAVALGKDMTLPATSAADAGEAMTELAKAGLSVEDSMAAAKGALQLAAAGQLNEAQAAAITANALNTFGLAGSEASRIADMLAAGANASSASVQDLAAGFQQGGFAFRAVGLSAEELITSIAALTNVGLTGSDAGTALKNAMIKLAAPTKDGAALMAALGINVFDAQGRMLPMPKVIDELNRGLAGMTQQERLAALNTIVLSDGAKALLPLLDLGSAGFSELQGKVTEQGAAAALAEAQMKGLRGALAGLGSQLETVGMEIATSVLPPLEWLVRKLADLVPKILEVSPNVRNAVLAFLAVAAAAGPVIAAIGGIAAAVAFLMTPLGLVVAAVGLVAAAFAGDFLGIRTAVQGVIEFLQDLRATVQDAGWQSSEAWEALSTVFGEQGATIIQSIVGVIDYLLELPGRIRGLIGIFGMWRERTDSIAEAMSSFMGTLGMAFPILQPLVPTVQRFIKQFDGMPAVDSFGLAVENVAYALEQMFPALRPVTQALQEFGLWAQGAQIQIETMARSMLETLRGVAAGIGPAVSGALARARGFIEEHSAQIQAVLGGAWAFITGMIRNKVMFVVNLVQALLALLSGQWEAAWGFLGAALDNKFGWIVKLLTGGSTSISEIFADLWPKVAEMGGAAFATIQSGIGQFMSGALPALTGFATQIGATFGAVLAPLQGLFGRVFASIAASLPAVLGILGAVFSTIGANIQFLVTSVLPIFLSFMGGAIDTLIMLWPALLATVSGVVNGIAGVVQSVLGVIGPFLQSHGDEIRTFIGEMWLRVQGIVQTALAIINETVIPMLQGIAAFIQTHSAEIQAVLGAAWTAIRTVIDVVLTTIQGLLRAVLQVIRGDWSGAWETLRSTAATVWEKIKNAVVEIASTLGPVLANIWDNIKSKAAEVWENVKAAAAQAWDGVKNAIQQKAAEILNAVLKWLDDTLVKIESFDLKAAAREFFGSILPGLLEKAGEIIASVGKWLTDVFNKIKGHDLKSAASASFQTVVAGIAAKVSEALTNVGKFLTDAAKRIREHTFRSETLTAVQTVVVGILDKVGEILKAVGGFLADISKAISSFDLAQAGRDLVQGFINGISSMASAVWQAAVNIAQQAWNAITGQQGIDAHSPSRKGIQAGVWVGEGLAVGIEQSAPISLGALGAHVKAIVDELARLANSVIEPAAIQSAQAVTDPLAKILENVGKMVDGLNKLADLKVPLSIGAQLQAVRDAVRIVVYHYQDMANNVVAPAAVMSAQAFTDPVAKIFENLGKIVEGTKRLGELATTGLNAGQITAQMTSLGLIVESVVKALSDVAGRLPDLGAAAAVLAQNAGPALALIEPAIAAFRALMTGGFTMDRADGPFGSLDTYTPVLTRIRGMAAFIQALASEVGTLALGLVKVLPAMKALGENVAPLLAIVTPTLDAYRDLVTRGFSMNSSDGPFGSVDTATPILTRIRGLAAFFQALASEVGTLALGLDKVLPAMKALGENVAPLLAVVTPALDAAKQLAEPLAAVPTTNFAAFGAFLEALAREVGTAAGRVADPLESAAKVLAENVGPVVSLVKGALEAMKALAGELAQPPTVNLTGLGTFLQNLAREVGTAAGGVKDDLQKAAKALADNAGPAVNLVKNTVEAMQLLAQDIGNPTPLNITALATFLYSLIDGLEWVTEEIDADLQKAVKAFAENAAPVLALVKTTLDIIKDLPNLAKTLTSWQYSRLPSNWLDQVTATLKGIVTGLAQAQLNVPAADLTAAKAFSDQMAQIIGWVKGGIDAIQGLMNAKRIGPWLADRIVQDFKYLFEAVRKGQGQLTPETLAEAQRFANDATAVAQDLVRGLTAFSGAAATTGLRDLAGVLAAVVAAMGEAAAALAREMAALRDGAYIAGYGWISQLAAGIRAGMPLLEAALQAVGDLFPHSPAKAGPLRQTPDWQAWMLGGMDRAAGLVASALNQVALPSGAAGYGAGMGGAQPLAVNFNGPITVREDADLVRLAGLISEMIGGRALQYQRLNTGWATVS